MKNYYLITSDKITIVSYGDGLQPGSYRVHSRFTKAINFNNKKSFASIVTTEVGAGPLNIVVSKTNLQKIHALKIGRQGFLVNNLWYSYANLERYNSKINNSIIDQHRFRANIDIFKKQLSKLAAPKSLAFLIDKRRCQNFRTSFDKEFCRRIELGVSKIFSDNVLTGVKMIKGTGPGLTPAGDDFIAGFLIALNIATRFFKFNHEEYITQIYNKAQSNNPISNAFLYCARAGFLDEHFKNLINSILYQGEKEIFSNTKKICTIGHTSGADVAVGFIYGILFSSKNLFLTY